MAEGQINPSKIMQVGMGFMASKTLLAAVKRGVFTELAQEPLTGPQLAERLNIHERGIYDFFDTLVALGFLQREGDGPQAAYSNAPDANAFLDRNKPMYIGGILEMANDRLYPFWSDLDEALETGQPQNEMKHTGKPIFEALYGNPEHLEQFLSAMTGVQLGNFHMLLEKFDFSRYGTLADIGGASGTLSVMAAKKFLELRCVTFDLPPVQPIAQRRIDEAGVQDRVKAVAGDFWEGGLPNADVIVMGNVLHDWTDDKKQALIQKAYDALPQGGVLIAVENIIDDERRQNAFGLLMSLNMLIEFGEDASDYTGAQFDGWARHAGFQRTEIIPLAGPSSAAIAYK